MNATRTVSGSETMRLQNRVWRWEQRPLNAKLRPYLGQNSRDSSFKVGTKQRS